MVGNYSPIYLKWRKKKNIFKDFIIVWYNTNEKVEGRGFKIKVQDKVAGFCCTVNLRGTKSIVKL